MTPTEAQRALDTLNTTPLTPTERAALRKAATLRFERIDRGIYAIVLDNQQLGTVCRLHVPTIGIPGYVGYSPPSYVWNFSRHNDSDAIGWDARYPHAQRYDTLTQAREHLMADLVQGDSVLEDA